MSLAQRANGPELMDADDLDEAVYADVVRDLARVNSVTLAARPTMRFLTRAARMHPSLRILDVGFGDGDMLRRIERWAAARKVDVELTGVDLNPRSEAAVRKHTPIDSTIHWQTGDYQDLASEPWDIVISSLVAHHMTEAELIAFLRFMDRHARVGWFINDLLRHRFAYTGFPLLARIAGWHPIVRHDGKLSIARSFRAPEWAPLLRDAGVTDARVFRAFPFRLCVERLR